MFWPRSRRDMCRRLSREARLVGKAAKFLCALDEGFELWWQGMKLSAASVVVEPQDQTMAPCQQKCSSNMVDMSHLSIVKTRTWLMCCMPRTCPALPVPRRSAWRSCERRQARETRPPLSSRFSSPTPSSDHEWFVHGHNSRRIEFGSTFMLIVLQIEQLQRQIYCSKWTNFNPTPKLYRHVLRLYHKGDETVNIRRLLNLTAKNLQGNQLHRRQICW